MSEKNAPRIVIDDSRVTIQILVSLTDDTRNAIYNHNMFILKTTDVQVKNLFYVQD
jgi:hypothetical protein